MAKKEDINKKSQTSDEEEQDTSENIYRRRHHHSHSYLGPVIIIAVGILFLFSNFGIVPWTLWAQIWRLWPIILILIGIEMMFGRSRWAQIIISILVVLFLLGIVWYFLSVQGVVAPMHFRYPHQMYPLQ